MCTILFTMNILPLQIASAALPDAVIKLSKPILARLITLVVAGLNVESVTSAEDLGKKYYESGITAPDWDIEGNLTIDVQAIDNARNWLDATYPDLPALIMADEGQSYIGVTLPPITPYTTSSSERTLVSDLNVSQDGLYKVNILDFGSITSWMGHDSGSVSPPDPVPTITHPPIIFDYGTNAYFIAKQTYYPAANPQFILWTYDDSVGSLYMDGNYIKSTESKSFYGYVLNTATNSWNSAESTYGTTAFKYSEGIIYESQDYIFADSYIDSVYFPAPEVTPPSNNAILKIWDGDTLASYELDMSMYSGMAQMYDSVYGTQQVPVTWVNQDNNLGLSDQFRWMIASSPSMDYPGKRDLLIWPSTHDLTYEWTDSDQYPCFQFNGTSGTNINFTINASPEYEVQAHLTTVLEYPKTDLIIGPKSTVPVVTGEPTNWNDINNIATEPIPLTTEPLDPLPEDPSILSFLGLFLDFFNKVWDWLTNLMTWLDNLLVWLKTLPGLIAGAMTTSLTDLFIPSTIEPIKEDFVRVKDAFSTAFPFNIAAGLLGLFTFPDSGIHYPQIGYNQLDPDGIDRYHIVFDFGDEVSGHRAMSDQLRQILTLGLWLGFAAGLLTLFLKKGGKIS